MAQWFFFLVLATCVIGSFGIDDPIALKNATFDKCKKQENVPDAPLHDIYHGRNMNGIKDYKCFPKCLMAEYGVVADGKINNDKVKIALTGHWPDKSKEERIIKSSMECVDKVKPVPDVCQYTFDVYSCFMDILEKERTEFVK